MPSDAQFAQTAAKMSLDRDSVVVCYDTLGVFSAPRLWYTLRAFGLEKVGVLEGGLPAWMAASGELESGAAPPPTPAEAISWDRVHSVQWCLQDVKDNLGSAQLVDARSAGRFNGTAPEPRPGLRGGHMPGSLSVPFTDVLTEEAGVTTFKSAEQLQQLFSDAGVDLTRPTVGTCGSGMTAAVVGLAIDQLPSATGPFSLYDGSWNEWGGLDDTAVVAEDGSVTPVPKKLKRKRVKRGYKGPRSAYIFFVQQNRPQVVEDNPKATFQEVGKLCGVAWGGLSDLEKKKYQKLADQDKKRVAKDKAAWEKANPTTVA
eukprot:TRINITY_DN12258_c0_g1_i5.p1 TRINITY_DN12258_c0_g1~~TRINITY_DN12258_c0_g1_i5.p1  ORF type:complete len:315 (-),score=63.20 TRINITY_DN12258_c0_g1_i5:226-1170(-)